VLTRSPQRDARVPASLESAAPVEMARKAGRAGLGAKFPVDDNAVSRDLTTAKAAAELANRAMLQITLASEHSAGEKNFVDTPFWLI
jgi:hypothetical protein